MVIPYTFYDGTDDTRKNAFRVAVQRWHANTCVALVEQNQADITRPYIKAEFCGGWVICKKLNLDQTVVERGFVGHEIPSSVGIIINLGGGFLNYFDYFPPKSLRK